MEQLDTTSFFNWNTELASTKLPDQRFIPNLIGMCERLELNNQLSFSAACGSAIRKSANRLFSKMDTSIQSGHIAQTAQRCSQQSKVFVLEDTTDADFKTHLHTEGLGDLGGYGKKELAPGEKRNAGLSIHTAFAVTQSKEPLGILGQHIWAPVNQTRKSALLKTLPIEEKESYKWQLSIDWVADTLGDFETLKVYIVGDREGDFYEHFAKERPKNTTLITRVLHKHRKVIFAGVRQPIKEVLPQLTYHCEKEVAVSARPGQKERVAKVSVYSGKVIMPPSKDRIGDDLELSIVWAIEQNPPIGVEALDWAIFSTDPVNSAEDALFVLDTYVLRWTIERFHYVLKQGLRIEKLQFDNFTRLSNAIRVCSMVAWRLIHVAYLSKSLPADDASKHFEPLEIEILQKATGSNISTVKDYILSLGKLVGFVKSAKQPYPGEKLMWQAYQILAAMTKGARLSKEDDFNGTG